MLQYVNERHTGYSFETPPEKINIDYLKGVLVYPEVSCCHVTAISIATTRGFQTLLTILLQNRPEMSASVCLCWGLTGWSWDHTKRGICI